MFLHQNGKNCLSGVKRALATWYLLIGVFETESSKLRLDHPKIKYLDPHFPIPCAWEVPDSIRSKELMLGTLSCHQNHWKHGPRKNQPTLQTSGATVSCNLESPPAALNA
jgi:hypothetical protein